MEKEEIEQPAPKKKSSIPRPLQSLIRKEKGRALLKGMRSRGKFGRKPQAG